MAHRSLTILSALLVASAATLGHAAELGEAQVLSHIGQALVADVEITLIDDPAAKVGVRLAHSDVYRGASIAMPPVLSSLNMAVMRRDGRQFLHLTSLKPVESRMLHVYLELVDGGQRNVRLVTLWLTPDPNPAPPPVREPVAEAVKAAPVLPVPVPVPPAPRPAAALQAGEEYIDAVRHPAPAPRKPLAQAVPVPKPTPQRKAAPAAAPGGTLACAAPAPNEHANACVALGAKNAALHQQLGTLEEKVKALQGAAPAGVTAPAPATAHAPAASSAPAAAPAAVPAPAADTAAEHAPTPEHAPAPAPAAKEADKPAPKGAPRIHRKPKKPVPPEPETPWLAIGGAIGAVLAAGALALMALRRRKRSSIGKIAAEHKPVKLPTADELAPKPNFMASVKARLMPGRGKEAAPRVAPVAEPVE